MFLILCAIDLEKLSLLGGVIRSILRHRITESLVYRIVSSADPGPWSGICQLHKAETIIN